MRRLRWSRKALVGVSFLAVMAALGTGQVVLNKAVAQGGKQAPRFEVDPFWPKPMPNNWVLGQAIGVAVDSRDHIWIVHRGSDPAPPDGTEAAVPITARRHGPRAGERRHAPPRAAPAGPGPRRPGGPARGRMLHPVAARDGVRPSRQPRERLGRPHAE